MDGFILKTIIPVVNCVKNRALGVQILREEKWKKGIKERKFTKLPDLEELSVYIYLKEKQQKKIKFKEVKPPI